MTLECDVTAKERLGGSLLPVTVIVASKNEEANIATCLLSLKQALRVLVVDSGSTDRTQAIARQHGAEVVEYVYCGGYPKKRQWALDNKHISTPWTLLIDADEQVTDPLWREIENMFASPITCAAFLVQKQFHFLGKRFRFGGFSHSAVVLFRTGHARFEEAGGNSLNGQDMEVHERLIVDGKVGRLRNPLVHDDCKGLFAYCDRHNKYSSWEASIRTHYLKTRSWGELSIKASIFGDAQSFRRFVKPLVLSLPCEPLMWFLYHFVLRGGMFEGRRGYLASSLRKAYIEQVQAKLYELKLMEKSTARLPCDLQGSEGGAQLRESATATRHQGKM